MAQVSPLNQDLTEPFLELIRLASTDLRPGIEGALEKARNTEEEGSAARNALEVILDNIRLARRKSTPICQDTGTPLFYINHPFGWSTARLEEEAGAAAAEATRRAFLRPNAVDPLTGRNSGDNRGPHFPLVHCREWDRPELEATLLLKGGGCENCGIQYTLPDASLSAGRDLEGVRKCVLDAALRAQGYGCAPGILGVGVGGDRASSMDEAKTQLLRPLDDVSPVEDLGRLEGELLEQVNRLGIGPMGFGGRTTAIGVKLGVRPRLPACYFVSVAYLCWAARLRRMTYKEGEVDYD